MNIGKNVCIILYYFVYFEYMFRIKDKIRIRNRFFIGDKFSFIRLGVIENIVSWYIKIKLSIVFFKG